MRPLLEDSPDHRRGQGLPRRLPARRTGAARMEGARRECCVVVAFSCTADGAPPPPVFHGERVGVRGKPHGCYMPHNLHPLTRIASDDAIRPLPASGARLAVSTLLDDSFAA